MAKTKDPKRKRAEDELAGAITSMPPQSGFFGPAGDIGQLMFQRNDRRPELFRENESGGIVDRFLGDPKSSSDVNLHMASAGFPGYDGGIPQHPNGLPMKAQPIPFSRPAEARPFVSPFSTAPRTAEQNAVVREDKMVADDAHARAMQLKRIDELSRIRAGQDLVRMRNAINAPAMDISRIRAMANANQRQGLDPTSAFGAAIGMGQQIGDAPIDKANHMLFGALLGPQVPVENIRGGALVDRQGKENEGLVGVAGIGKDRDIGVAGINANAGLGIANINAGTAAAERDAARTWRSDEEAARRQHALEIMGINQQFIAGQNQANRDAMSIETPEQRHRREMQDKQFQIMMEEMKRRASIEDADRQRRNSLEDRNLPENQWKNALQPSQVDEMRFNSTGVLPDSYNTEVADILEKGKHLRRRGWGDWIGDMMPGEDAGEEAAFLKEFIARHPWVANNQDAKNKILGLYESQLP